MGVREPFEDWTTGRNALCQHCASEQLDLGHIKTESKKDDKKTRTMRRCQNEKAGRYPNRSPKTIKAAVQPLLP